MNNSNPNNSEPNLGNNQGDSQGHNQRLIDGKMKLAAKALTAGGKEPTQEVQGTGKPNRHGMPKLPVGQHMTKSWPVLDLGVKPEIPLDKWSLKVHGDVKNAFTLSWKDFMELPQVVDVSDFHCVTSWSLMDSEWEGVRLKHIVELAGVDSEVQSVIFRSPDGYSANIRFDEIDEDVLIAHKWQGQPLPVEHGGPARIIVPKKYAWKGTKWVQEIEFQIKEELGFWEVRGYSNTAEPWYNDRYSSNVPPPGANSQEAIF